MSDDVLVPRDGPAASEPDAPRLRLARLDERDAIEALMKTSTRALFPAVYDAAQTASSVRFVAALDPMLIEDGTYYVAEVDGALVACGGWSRRAKLYAGSGAKGDDARLLDPKTEPARVRAMFVRDGWTRRGLGTAILRRSQDAARAEGFRSLVLVATLPGVPLYERFGFVPTERLEVRMPDGVVIGGVAMSKPIA